jgi:hypothetical protein
MAAAQKLKDEIGKCEAELKGLTESFFRDRAAKAGNSSRTSTHTPAPPPSLAHCSATRLSRICLFCFRAVKDCKEGNAAGAVTHSIRERRSLRGHFGKIYALHWCKSEGKSETNDERVVSASQDGKLIVRVNSTCAAVRSAPPDHSLSLPFRSLSIASPLRLIDPI